MWLNAPIYRFVLKKGVSSKQFCTFLLLMNFFLTVASCTNSCLSPVARVVHEKLGIRHDKITTIHDANTNLVVDAQYKDLRSRDE